MEAASWSCMYLCNYYSIIIMINICKVVSLLVVGAVGEGERVCIV